MRPYQVATAAIFMLIAAVAMFDTRGGALPDASGGAPGGLRGGWYPFWSAALTALALAVVAWRSATLPQPAEGVFAGRQSVVDVLRLIVPIFALVIVMDPWLGFYVGGAIYLGFFARIIGRYRWIWSLAPAILIPAALFLVFEIGFRVPLPKSFLYIHGLPF